MIEVLRDRDKRLTAVCEYLILTEDGHLHNDGTKIFIGELEINPEHRGKGLVKYFIKTLMDKYPKIDKCFFVRKRKYPDRDCRMWTRKKLEILLRG
jgi:hypothetical protein